MSRFLLPFFACLFLTIGCASPEVSITWIEDKPGPILQDKHIFNTVPDSLWGELGLTEGIPSSMSAFLMQVGDKNILFDAGLGAPFSQLLPVLNSKGLTPDDIDYIYITHMHPDHIGGLLKEGSASFANAEVYVNRLEAEAWLAMPHEKSGLAKAVIDAYSSRLHCFEAGDELPLGVKTIAAYGHTPGHTCYQKDNMLIIADILHGAALQLKYPECCPFYDMDREKAIQSRTCILDYARENNLTMYGHHLPAPGYIQPSAAITNDDVILHAWCWSFDTIRENLPDIAKAGYTIVQTSPAQHCVTGTPGDEEGGQELFGHGRWYYHYQPTAWAIGNQHVGTSESLVALCREVRKYGIRIIVDVLPNHTAIDQSKVEPEMDAAVGGHENLYHANGLTPIRDYNDRYECTTGEMGGLPDVNTENPDFQKYYMNYVNELLSCGVRGFRYDTAKHIGLPDDPRDAKVDANDFWDVATGRKSVGDVHLALPMDSLFVYGEVLQDRNVREEGYADYVGLTASSYGYKLRNNLHAGSWNADDPMDWAHPVDPCKLVSWVESHDTYCNDHESASLSDAQIRAAWVFLVSRSSTTPLFYSRPDGSDGPQGNYWGNNIAGAKGNDNFKHPIVAQANKFRKEMSGLEEHVSFPCDGAVAMVVRGSKGASLVNISSAQQTIEAPTHLADGVYKDKVSGAKFKVKNGVIKGVLEPLGCYVLR